MDRFLRLGLVVSIVAMSAVRAASHDGFIRAANVDEHVDDVRVNIDDRRTVNLVTAFSRADPDGTVHTLEIDGDLSLKATTSLTSEGRLLNRIELISSKGGKPRVLATSTTDAVTGQIHRDQFLSVCGDRIISVFGWHPSRTLRRFAAHGESRFAGGLLWWRVHCALRGHAGGNYFPWPHSAAI